MHSIEITGRKFDSCYIPMRELLCRRLKPVGKKPVCHKIPLENLIFLVFENVSGLRLVTHSFKQPPIDSHT